MNTPRVSFSIATVSQDTEWMYQFLFNDRWGWGKRILAKHPGLEPIMGLSTQRSRVQFLHRYLTKFHRTHRVAIAERSKTMERAWRRVERSALRTLSEIIETPWSRRAITAYVSLNPICPRFLRTQSFSVYWKFPTQFVMEVIAHECCHFLYFKKWREVFPRSNPRTFDSPYLTWHLSEILAPVILNDPRMRRILRDAPTFYREHRGLSIRGTNVPRYFTALYRRYVGAGKDKDFGEFLKVANAMIQKHYSIFRPLGARR